jgi:hypothetical protein
LLLLGVRLLFDLRYKLKAFAIAFGLVDIVCVVLLFFAAAVFINNIKEEQTITEHVATIVCPDTIYLSAKQSNLDSSDDIRISFHDEEIFNINRVENGLWINATSLAIKQAKDDSLSSYILKTAYGAQEEESAELARLINYSFQPTDSIINLSSHFFVNGSKYQFQHVQVKLRIPLGTIIKVDQHVLAMLNRNSKQKQRFFKGSTLLMTTEGLKCLDCIEEQDEQEVIDIELEEGEVNSDIDISINTNKPDSQADQYKAPIEMVFGPLSIKMKQKRAEE